MDCRSGYTKERKQHQTVGSFGAGFLEETEGLSRGSLVNSNERTMCRDVQSVFIRFWCKRERNDEKSISPYSFTNYILPMIRFVNYLGV